MVFKHIAIFLFLSIGRLYSSETTSLVPIPKNSVGVIIDSATKVVRGTAFLVKRPGGQLCVVTCAHAALGGKFAYKPHNSEQSYPLEHQIAIESQDISIFGFEKGLNVDGWSSLDFGEDKRLGTGDQIVYLGYKVDDKTLQSASAPILATGTGLTYAGGIADFIEFEGVAKPGFSGGPVFNPKGAVVALITEAWSKRRFHAQSKTSNINRAVLTTAGQWILNETKAFRP